MNAVGATEGAAKTRTDHVRGARVTDGPQWAFDPRLQEVNHPGIERTLGGEPTSGENVFALR